MAQIRDEYGNPVQITDEHGNPVKLIDELGNPIHFTGVATMGGTGTRTDTSEGMHVLASRPTGGGGYGEHGGALGGAGAAAGHGMFGGKQTSDQSHGYGVGEHRQQQPHGSLASELRRSGSLSSNARHILFFLSIHKFSTLSSEGDDGQGGRRKKKGLKEKIKDKFGGEKHKDDQQQAYTHGHGHGHATTAVKTTTVTRDFSV
ncbi:hypothetical protein EV2_035451 [Malus domestica]